MKLPANTTRIWMLAACVSSAGLSALGQDSAGQSLGDLARKTRQERSAAGYVPAKKVTTEDYDGPDGSGVWRIRLCTITPCYELSITLPKDPHWTRAAEEPRAVFIPISGHEADASRAIRVYAAESTHPGYTVDSFKRTFLESWFAKPEYFGQPAVLTRDEHVPIDWSTGTITHFTITTDALKFRGLSVIANSAPGIYGFACVFREEDSSVGTSICEAIVGSAQYQELEPSTVRRTYPEADDPADDPPENNNDPE